MEQLDQSKVNGLRLRDVPMFAVFVLKSNSKRYVKLSFENKSTGKCACKAMSFQPCGKQVKRPGSNVYIKADSAVYCKGFERLGL